jgi:hypothetical protein
MSWSAHHSKSERYAGLAENATRQRDFSRAIEFYRHAAQEETSALSALDTSKTRTLGITAVSAASLWYKAREFPQAELVAHQWLASGSLPAFAVEQLQSLLQTVWLERARQQSGVTFVEGEILVSVSGGDIVPGGAPLDLILRKVDEVKGLFFRTIEYMLELPLRKRGAPMQEIQDKCRPWLFHAPIGSYQFAVRIQKPLQLSFLEDPMPKVEQITRKFIDIVKASAQEPGIGLEDVVPNKEYRETFLKLARNLAPTGKTYQQLTIRSLGEPDVRPVIFIPNSREAINSALRTLAPPKATDQTQEFKPVRLTGVLRGLQLDQDWIEINVLEPSQQTIRIHDVGDVVDDEIGPLVNRRVLVDVVQKKADGKYQYRDIQAEE